jgi:SAM-dependent methyltransferase
MLNKVVGLHIRECLGTAESFKSNICLVTSQYTMKIAYRRQKTKHYWKRRWSSLSEDKAILNPNVYPLKYAKMAIKSKDGKILEAGCGNGRVLGHYFNEGYKISGFDYIHIAAKKSQITAPSASIVCADVKSRPYFDGEFLTVLAFGLLHNLETGLKT